MGRRVDLKWGEWNPGLDTDDMTITEVLATCPAASADDVPAIIRILPITPGFLSEAV